MTKSTRLTCPLGNTCRTETEDEIVQCHWYTRLLGLDPQTGKDIEEWGCAMKFMPMLQIETSQQTRQAGAAVESLRNVVASKRPVLNPVPVIGPGLAKQ